MPVQGVLPDQQGWLPEYYVTRKSVNQYSACYSVEFIIHCILCDSYDYMLSTSFPLMWLKK